VLLLQEDDIQKAIFVGNYEGAVDTFVLLHPCSVNALLLR
jgi:hypothetical protein